MRDVSCGRKQRQANRLMIRVRRVRIFMHMHAQACLSVLERYDLRWS